MIQEIETKNGNNVDAYFEGEYQEVAIALNKYFIRFSPYGYQTTVLSDVTVDGVRKVKTTRWNNCD